MKRVAPPRARRLRRSAGAITVAALAAGAVAATLGGPAWADTAARPAAAANVYHFTTLNNDRDLTFNQLLGINNRGKIAGYFGSRAKGHPNYADSAGNTDGMLARPERHRPSSDSAQQGGGPEPARRPFQRLVPGYYFGSAMNATKAPLAVWAWPVITPASLISPAETSVPV
jgi:hypothetical protein